MPRGISSIFVFLVVGVAPFLAPNLAIGQFTTSWYAQFYEELLPAMLGLHKPILAFGTHSLAGFFAYLLFWLNWQIKQMGIIFLLLMLMLLSGQPG